MLAATARSLGGDDPRTEQQRRSDLFADLLLGRLVIDQSDDADDDPSSAHADDSEGAGDCDWLEVEDIDPDTGELLGTQLQRIDCDGEPIGEPVDATQNLPSGRAAKLIKRPKVQRSVS